MNTLLYVFLAICLFVGGIGLIAPAMISAPSDIMVVAGFALIFITIYLEYLLFRLWAKTNKG